jgi:hypothetical protein
VQSTACGPTTEGLSIQGIVQEVKPNQLLLKDGSVLDFGICIWSTGVGPTQFIESLPFSKTKVGRIAVTKHLQVLHKEDQVCTALASNTRSALEVFLGCCLIGTYGIEAFLMLQASCTVARAASMRTVLHEGAAQVASSNRSCTKVYACVQDMDAPSVATQATLADTDSAVWGAGAAWGADADSCLVPCDSVYALGDCAAYVDGPLPALAQVRGPTVCPACLAVSQGYMNRCANICALALRCVPCFDSMHGCDAGRRTAG